MNTRQNQAYAALLALMSVLGGLFTFAIWQHGHHERLCRDGCAEINSSARWTPSDWTCRCVHHETKTVRELEL